MKVLIVLTSHSDLGDTGHKTGFWIEEFAAPYYVLACLTKTTFPAIIFGAAKRAT